MDFPTWSELKASGHKFNAVLQEARKDGKIQVTDVLRLIVAGVESVMETADGLAGATGNEKREWVISIVWEAYKEDFDVDLPIVFEPFETMIESVVVHNLVPQLIESIVRASKGLVVNRPDAPTGVDPDPVPATA